MKKFSLCAILCLFSYTIMADQLIPPNKQFFKYKFSGKKEKMSQTFIFPRPAYFLSEARQFLAHEFFAEKNCGGAIIDVLGIYQRAGASERVGRYFAINDTNVLTVKGDDVVPINRDVRAEWLGLGADYEGELSLTPQQMQWAACIELQQDFKRFTDNWLISTFYLSLQLPIQHVKNNMNFSAPEELKAAFNRPELQYAKIPTESQSITSVPEIIFRLGSFFLNQDGFELGVYSLFGIPTAHEAKPEYLFTPFLGFNNHWGGGTGFNFQMPLNGPTCDGSNRIFAFYIDLEHRFLFRATQMRTLDVRLKEWSRYMLVNSKSGQCNIPAANVLTRKVRVEPYSMFDGSSGFRLYNDNLAFEFGYGCFAHGTEWLRLKEPWLEEFGFSGTGNNGDLVVNCVPVCPTASRSTISCQAPNDVDQDGNLIFVPIKWQDLNFYSGAARSAVVNRVHVAVGYKADFDVFAFFAGGGAFGEFPTLNTAFSQWGVWGTFGATF